MNPDIFWPIIRESLEWLRYHGIKPADLTRPGGGDHHFSGYGLWCRNRFIHPPAAPLRDFFRACPDTVSSWLRRLIARHGEADEQTWRRILMAETVSGSLLGIGDYQRKSRLVEGNDDEL